MAYFCEQQIDILQIISKNTQSTKNTKKLLNHNRRLFQNLQETQLFRTADKDRLRRYILKLLDSRGATLNAPLEEF